MAASTAAAAKSLLRVGLYEDKNKLAADKKRPAQRDDVDDDDDDDNEAQVFVVDL